MKQYANCSYWLETCGEDLTPRTKLDGSIDVDVAILGAGYSGLWTAYYLQALEPSLKIAIIEKVIAGFGASGRNGSWCTCHFPTSYGAIAAHRGRDAAVALYRAMAGAVDEVARVATAEGIDIHFERGGGMTVARGPQQLPAVRDHFVVEGAGQYLVSDYVDGEDARALLAQYGPLPSDLIIEWLQALCQPLVYLHEKGVLHLDVKPANMRIAPDGAVFLVDSGLPGLGIAPGARGYASPEQQKQSNDVGPAADIYSLGATLYTLLTDAVPPGALQRESGLEEMLAAREVNPDVEPYLSNAASHAAHSVRAW